MLWVCSYWEMSVRPSVPHPVSALLCLQFWLDPFHIYTSHQATSEGASHVKFLAQFKNLYFGQFFKICNFDFVLFWLGIWCKWLVWVIMGQRGVSQNAGVLVVLVVHFFYVDKWRIVVIRLQQGPCFSIKTVSPGNGYFRYKDKGFHGRFIFTMGIPILVQGCHGQGKVRGSQSFSESGKS